MEVADIVNFYRATLCCAVSAVARCPSVRSFVRQSDCLSVIRAFYPDGWRYHQTSL